MLILGQGSVPSAKAFESLRAHGDGEKWLCQRDLRFCYSNKCLGKKDFFCLMISEVLLDGLSFIAFGPVVRHYNIAGVCVEKACLPHGIQGKRGGQGLNIPISHSRICPYWPYFFYLNFTASSKLPSPPPTSYNTTGW